MRYVSVFSGIEAATVAWAPLGWEAVCFSEVAKFPSALLSYRYPEVPNLGDIKKIDWSLIDGGVDVVVGGSPCQSFSVAGARRGLSGQSGLMWEYVRCVREVRPRWFVWENVPGALSSSNGEDFRCMLESMDALGYGMAWRVLDAQFFNLAQRRERLFLVGRLGDPSGPCEVLFERGDEPYSPVQSRYRRKEIAADPEGGVGETGGFRFRTHGGFGVVGYCDGYQPCIISGPRDSSVVHYSEERGVHVARILTPLECERMFGFPEGYTKIPFRGLPAEECPDAPRYTALGNTMAVPVMRWIGERIQEVEDMA